MSKLTHTRTFLGQNNPWGKIRDPQRTDLWYADLDAALTGIAKQVTSADVYEQLGQLKPFEVASISIPELRVKAEPVRRDSRVYNMPSWDDPLDAVKIVFILGDQSSLVRILDAWRAIVRAGRGGVSAESNFILNDDYRIDYAFDIQVFLVRGGTISEIVTAQPPLQRSLSPPVTNEDITALNAPPQAQPPLRVPYKPDFDISHVLVLKNCWLAGYKFGELAYDGAKIMTVEANFYAEDVLNGAVTAQSASRQDWVVPTF